MTVRLYPLPPFSLLRDFSFQNTSEHFAIRFRQSYLPTITFLNYTHIAVKIVRINAVQSYYLIPE